MMCKTVHLIICCLFLLASCDKSPSLTVGKVDERELKKISVKPSLVNPQQMFVAADRLVVYQRNADFPLVVYPFPFTGEGYYDCTAGRANGEFMRPDDRSFIYDCDGFSYYEQGGVKKRFELDGEGHFYCTHIEQVDLFGEPLNGLKELSSGLLNVSLNADYEFVIVKPDGTKKFICKYPDLDIGEDEFKPMRFYKTVTVHPGRNKFACFYGFAPLFRIVSSDGEIDKEITFAIDGIMKEPYKRPLFFWGGVCSDDKFILAKVADTDFVLLDWEGKVLKWLRADTAVSLFTYDFSADRLYACNMNDEGVDLYYCEHFLGK